MTHITPCDIIRDLLPLYHDGACSQASRAAVEEHIADCGDCRALLTKMERPLAVIPSPAPSASRMKEAKRRLARRTALTVIAALVAMCLLIAGGASLYTEFEVLRPVGYTDALVESVAQVEGVTEIRFNLKRYDSAQCLLRRVTIGGERRDIACVLLSQTWLRKYLDWSAGGTDMVALGAGTGLAVSRGGLSYGVYYGYEYEPEMWNPNWRYPGCVTEIYYWDSAYTPAAMTDWPEEDFMRELEQYGKLIWRAE